MAYRVVFLPVNMRLFITDTIASLSDYLGNVTWTYRLLKYYYIILNMTS